MQGYNLIVVFDKSFSKMLMCKRLKEPYLGLMNFVGGKIEQGESGIDAAYRELFEEAAIERKSIDLIHLMDFSYPLDPCYVEVYAGRLKEEVTVSGDENTLFWQENMEDNFFDMTRYAGEGNIGHILEHIKLNRKLFG
ncbi:MAG: NUDIX domain-containing protein [Ruminiclostridium sp.]|nr:NUDIX domain-containing protein [Ruminiclostridium sp.]